MVRSRQSVFHRRGARGRLTDAPRVKVLLTDGPGVEALMKIDPWVKVGLRIAPRDAPPPVR